MERESLAVIQWDFFALGKQLLLSWNNNWRKRPSPRWSRLFVYPRQSANRTEPYLAEHTTPFPPLLPTLLRDSTSTITGYYILAWVPLGHLSQPDLQKDKRSQQVFPYWSLVTWQTCQRWTISWQCDFCFLNWIRETFWKYFRLFVILGWVKNVAIFW